MYKILYIIIVFLIVTNCSVKKVVKHHGVPNLEKKQMSLKINESNKNDILKILGQPSTKSKFDNDTWIYISWFNCLCSTFLFLENRKMSKYIGITFSIAWLIVFLILFNYGLI